MGHRDKEMVDSWRLFIAIELPAEIRHSISEHIARLRAACPDVQASWTREHNLHLTLKFFGDIPVNRVDLLAQALTRAAARTSEFELVIQGCFAFSTRGKPNVLCIGINDLSNNLHKLQESLEDECAQAGFDRDRRPFHPHLTIARIRNPKHARSLSQLHYETAFDSVAFEVNGVCLFRSELSSQGSRYTILARQEFSG